MKELHKIGSLDLHKEMKFAYTTLVKGTYSHGQKMPFHLFLAMTVECNTRYDWLKCYKRNGDFNCRWEMESSGWFTILANEAALSNFIGCWLNWP